MCAACGSTRAPWHSLRIPVYGEVRSCISARLCRERAIRNGAYQSMTPGGASRDDS